MTDVDEMNECEICHEPFKSWTDPDGDQEESLCRRCYSDNESHNGWESHEFGDN
jgi:hypothetical protein